MIDGWICSWHYPVRSVGGAGHCKISLNLLENHSNHLPKIPFNDILTREMNTFIR